MHYTISIVKSTLIVYNKEFVFLFGLKHFRNCWEMLVVWRKCVDHFVDGIGSSYENQMEIILAWIYYKIQFIKI